MKQIDNLLGQNHYDMMKLKLDNSETPWYYTVGTANYDDPITPYGSSFSHLIFLKDKGSISTLIDITMPILLSSLDKQNLLLKELYRIRLGLITRVPYQVIHPPHIDNPEICPQPHTVGIYYVSASDGDTIVYNETETSDSYTEQARSKPIGNNWMDFDGRYYHSSSAPQEYEHRVAITFNYLSEAQ